MRRLVVGFLALVMGCSGGQSDGRLNDSSDPPASWTISVRTNDTGTPLDPALLGHYDLSGALYDYPNVSGLMSAMANVGFSEWRVGSGRWEQASELLPTLTSGANCAPDTGIFSTTAATDNDLMRARDWFTFTDGSDVTVGDTAVEGRYDLDYIRSVIDTAELFGAAAYVSIDHMPRALSINQTANRVDCATTFMNAVSNNQPQDTDVFASAVTGLVQRVVEGTGSQTGIERPRDVVHWEVWNEPELQFFWQPGWDSPNIFFDMALPVLVSLDAYRTRSGHSELKFGLGSFVASGTATAVISAFDEVPVPMDFISFHEYDDDPLVIVDNIEQVTAAAQSSTNYQDIEIVLAEWGPDLVTRGGDQGYAAGMAPPLHASTVIALGAAAGLNRAHGAIFYDYFPTLALGLVDNNGQPRTLFRGYEMMAKVIRPGTVRLSPTGMPDGKLDDGMGAVLVSRDGANTIRVLLINRNADQRTIRVEMDGLAASPTAIYVLDDSDDPIDPLRTILPTGTDVVMPANALLVLEF